MVADLASPGYKFELSSTVPSVGMVRIVWLSMRYHFIFSEYTNSSQWRYLIFHARDLYKLNIYLNYFMLQPKATLKFPLGEVSLEDKYEEQEDEKKTVALSGILKSHILDGVCTAHYNDEILNFRYAFKVVYFVLLSIPTYIIKPSKSKIFRFCVLSV